MFFDCHSSAEATDADALTKYVHQVFQTSQYLLTQADEFHNDVSKEAQWILEMKENPSKLLLIALLNDKIIGNIDLHSY